MKRFDQDLHDSTDVKAKNKFKELLVDSNYEVIDNPDKHGVDLFLFKQGKHLCNIEVEIKTNWKGSSKFDFPNLNFLRRKEKYCKLAQPTLFVLFNNNLTQYFTVQSKDVLVAPIEEVENKYVKSGEMFRKISLDKVTINKVYKSVEEILK